MPRPKKTPREKILSKIEKYEQKIEAIKKRIWRGPKVIDRNARKIRDYNLKIKALVKELNKEE